VIAMRTAAVILKRKSYDQDPFRALNSYEYKFLIEITIGC